VKLVRRFGAKYVVFGGPLAMALGFVLDATFSAQTGGRKFAVSMVVLRAGIGLTFAPATESIMDSRPVEKVVVGSAVNESQHVNSGVAPRGIDA
jgi:hypothetical protein